MKRTIVASLAMLVVMSPRAAAQPAYNTVALSGQQAPGVAAGGGYSSFSSPILNSAGQTAFFGSLTGTGITASNNYGIWAGSTGSLALVARFGSAAPGIATGGVYSGLSNPALNSAGQTAFVGSLTGTGVTPGSNDVGIWAGSTGSLALVARSGSAAPGVLTGGVYSNFNNPVYNSAGQTAFIASLTGTGINGNNDSGIWATVNGGLKLIAREGFAAPGVAGGQYSRLGNPVLNSAGQTAFFSVLDGIGINGDGSNDRGIWVGSPNSLALVARAGSAAPGIAAGGVYVDFEDPVLNSSGQMAFNGFVTGTGITANNNEGLWAGSPGSLALVAREGSAAPGIPTGGVYSTLGNPVLNTAGQMAFGASLTGSGIISGNNTGIWVGSTGNLALVARSGSAAPGVAAGDVFAYFDSPVLNNAGQTAFVANLTGTGINASNNHGLWATDKEGLKLIVREGDLFDVDPGIGVDNRTILSITFTKGSGGEDGRGLSFNDAGLLVFGLSFTDGSSGVFTASLPIPEPALLGLALPALLMLRRRKSHREATLGKTM
jgi:hypothetical protein